MNIYLNGVSVYDAVPKGIIHAIKVNPPTIKTQYTDLARGGRIRQSALRNALTIDLDMQFHTVGDPTARAECVDLLNAWAAPGGYLTLSNRPGKRIYVMPETLASEGTLHKSDEIASVRFSADLSPFWEDAEATTAETPEAAAGDTAGVMQRIPGTAETPLSAVITPTAAITTVTISGGGLSITLEGAKTLLEDGTYETQAICQAGETIEVGYEDYTLFIRNGTTSLLPLRTEDSADEIMLAPGFQNMSVTADASVKALFSYRGRYQ